MRKATFLRPGIALALAVWAALAGVAAAGTAEQNLAREILEAAGVRGGLVVHVGCGDGTLTAALRASSRYLVHGLATDPADVARAREHVRARGLTGAVTIERWTPPRLPYADNLVNLLVAADLGGVPPDEVMRVLCPEGVAYERRGDRWTTTVKPRPEAMDEWTHFLHDADGNAVARDTVVGPPRRAQWVGEPRWARSHEHLGSISAVVSSGGRIFYIADRGPAASVALPSQWWLMARDAFSGVLLWQRQVGLWETQLRGFRSGPAHLPRRLVAVGDRVYATLGYGKPVAALDGTTGDVVHTYDDTRGTLEIVFCDGVLFCVTGEVDLEAAAEAARRGQASPPARRKRLLALRADTGKVLWAKADADTAELMPLTLAVAGGRVFFQNPRHVMSLEAASGRERWRAERSLSLKRPAWSTPTLVVCGDVVLSADRAAPAQAKGGGSDKVDWVVSIGGGGAKGQLVAYSAQTGQELWRCPCSETYNAPPDVFVVDGQVWTGQNSRARDPGFTTVRDLATGKVARRFDADKLFTQVGMPHHRCHRNKATSRYILASKAGIEFIDVATGKAELHNWVRGTCQYGIVPCNGLVYAPSHSCACFIKAKLNGFWALAPGGERSGAAGADGQRLERGPAYGATRGPEAGARIEEWPTYRHDAARSGSTPSAVPARLEPAWRTPLGGRLSAAVVGDGKVFVACVDDHAVHALDAADGKRLWRFQTGGRVDSPPTLHEGLALFGSADGCVYAVRASDGVLAWRFRAAPEARRIVAYDQVESAWPVPGSVLVRDGVAWCAAGRSSFLDGGIYLYRLEPRTGEKLSQTRVSSYDPQTGRQPPARGFEMDGALPDVLSSAGGYVYMRHVKFDGDGVERDSPGLHLFSPTGFLDGSWWHRSYWLYGEQFNAGWGGWWRAGNRVPAGRLLVFDDEAIYGYGRSFYPGGNAGQWRQGEHYRLFACARDAEAAPVAPRERRKRRAARQRVPCRWEQRVPLLVRAMVLAGKTLFVAGPPHLPDDDPEAVAALQGRKGGLLWAVSTADGQRLAELRLEAAPVFDGLAAARGRLFLATVAGDLCCFRGE